MPEMHGQIPLAGRKYPITQRIAKPKPPKMRKCTQCGGVFPINEFPLRADGGRHSTRCYECALLQHSNGQRKDGKRKCKQCGNLMPLSMFGRSGRGYRTLCKPCEAEHSRKYRQRKKRGAVKDA